MYITLEDIADMASPGWGEDLDLEVLEDLDKEGFGEVEEEEEVDPIVRFDGGGRREGMSTADICTRLKNEHVSKFEREFSAILKTYPKNGTDLKVLLWLASGFSYHQVAALLGRCYKTIKNTAARLRQFRDNGIVKLLPQDQVQSGAALLGPLPKSKAGRKPQGATKPTATNPDLFGDPVAAHKPRRPRKAATPRVRVACPEQMSLLHQEAA